MCLNMYAIATKNTVGDKRLSKASGLRILKYSGKFHFSRNGGCSCSLMADNAAIDAATWELDASILPGLSAAIKLLNDESEGFTFQALFIGDEIEPTEHRTSIKELLKDIESNKVKNRYIYIVGKISDTQLP